MKKYFILVILLTFLSACKKAPKNISRIEGIQISNDTTAAPDTQINEMIFPYKNKLDAEMNTILCYTPINLVRSDGRLESSLGNLIADLCQELSHPIFYKKNNKNIDFTLLNYGGIRASIPIGDITLRHAFKLMPFENELVVCELSSIKMNALFEYLEARKLAHPISKELNLKIDGNQKTILINKKPFDKNKTYHILTSDYLQSGGDQMNFFKNPIALYKIDYKVRNAIIDFFSKTDTISVKLDSRFTKI